MKTKRRVNGWFTILVVLLIVTLTASLMLARFYLSEFNENKAFNADILSFKAEISELQTEVSRLAGEVSLKQTELDKMASDFEECSLKVSALEGRIEELTEQNHTTKNEKEQLVAQTDALRLEITALNSEIETLKSEIAASLAQLEQLEQINETGIEEGPDITAENLLIDQLMQALEKEAPNNWYKISEFEEQYIEEYPRIIAYSYFDLTTEDKIEYNADEILYSASLIKALYIYSVLREISEFEKGKADLDDDGNILYLPGEEKYNLDEEWVYDSASMFEEGSGEIQSMPDGTKMTWHELFEQTLLYSDNIAFAQIMNRFGRMSFDKMIAELDIKGTSTGFMNLSANDCIKFLKELYDFFETGEKYALFMKENMMKSKHTVMICASFEPGTVPHKYGWDIGAYHDMAIIYDEFPYLLVIMTDLDSGGKKVDNYIKSLVTITKQIHAERHSQSN